MPRREEKEIPIKIGGWDGKFVYEKPVLKEGYVFVSHKRKRSNLHTQDQRPLPQPQQLDRKYSETLSGDDDKYHDQCDSNKPRSNAFLFENQHQSNANNFYGFNTDTEVLPVEWSGKFQLDPNDIRIKPERNISDARDYADHRNFVHRN